MGNLPLTDFGDCFQPFEETQVVLEQQQRQLDNM